MIEVDDLRVYDVNECAKMLSVSPATIRKYMKQGKIACQLIGNKYYSTEGSIKDFLKGDRR